MQEDGARSLADSRRAVVEVDETGADDRNARNLLLQTESYKVVL